MKTIWAKVCLPIIILAALVSLAGCSDSRLTEAERLLETDVKAADSILSSMPMPTSRRDRAWYAVLKTQADYKQYKTITSDSLILTATSYYGTHHKNYRSAMAWYSQGCVYAGLDNEISAIKSYLRALDLYPDTLNRYYALTEMKLGDLYLKKAMYNEALSSYSSCRNNAFILNDTFLISYCDYKTATIYLYEKKYSLAASLLVESIDDEYLSPFYRNESKIKYGKVLLYGYNDLQTAYGLLINCLKESERANGFVLSAIGVIHYKMCNYDSAYYYFNKSLEYVNEEYTRSTNYRYLLELSSMMGNTKEALEYSSRFTNVMDSIMIIENSNDIASVNIQYAQESYQFKRRELLIRTFIVTVSLFVILLLCAIYLYQYRIRKNQEYYISLSDKYRVRQIVLKPNGSESEIIDYCLRLFKSTPSYGMIKDGCENINNPLRQSILHDLTVSFSEYYSFARSRYPDFNTNYINYCILHYLDFTHQQIIEILCISENNYRVSKSRIRKIIDKDNILYPR